MAAKRRLDALLVERGLVETRSLAQALVMAGRVHVDGAPVTKAGAATAETAAVEVVAPPRFVSRGGEKLESALAAFGVEPAGERCLDVGASTGGFTDCLLQHGAAEVVALDVGRHQLHERLRSDPRVTVLDGINARSLDCAALPFRPGLVTADVSFISLRLVLPAVLACAEDPWRALVLVKPQFEAGRGDVKRGVVRDPEVRRRVLQDFA
jgi:23S rRNA (cytidine1920-2'-O)/16S rRNA (cytidine1409-2'-O)-methyltransferase